MKCLHRLLHIQEEIQDNFLKFPVSPKYLIRGYVLTEISFGVSSGIFSTISLRKVKNTILVEVG